VYIFSQSRVESLRFATVPTTQHALLTDVLRTANRVRGRIAGRDRKTSDHDQKDVKNGTQFQFSVGLTCLAGRILPIVPQ